MHHRICCPFSLNTQLLVIQQYTYAMLTPLFRALLFKRGFLISLQHARCYGEQGSLHLSLEPLDEEDEGVFQLTLTRPEAKNAIGKSFQPVPFPLCTIW